MTPTMILKRNKIYYIDFKSIQCCDKLQMLNKKELFLFTIKNTIKCI